MKVAAVRKVNGVVRGEAHTCMCPSTPGEEHNVKGPGQGHTLRYRQAATFPAGKGESSGGVWV